MRSLFRPAYIGLIALRFGLDGLLLHSLRRPRWSLLARVLAVPNVVEARRLA